MATGIEINPKLVGALFTDKIGDILRVFCYYTNGETSQFDVPGEENRENLRGLLASLNTEETCTTLIHDEVIQGRVYVQTGKDHWLYTVLRSPGQVPPPLNADIADLPWKVCWRSNETEVLRFAQPDGLERCMAVRTHLSENDASRLARTSKAFLRPVSVPRRQPQRWASAYTGIALIALLAAGIVVGGTLFYTLKKSHAPVAGLPTHVAEAKVTPEAGTYYLLYNHRISGPFPAKIIADMSAGGLFNDETMCRPENSTDWGKVAAVFPHVAQN